MSPQKPRQALLLHGFTGSTYDLQPIKAALEAKGFRTVAPVLTGHQSTPQALSTARMEDWLVDAQKGFDALDPKQPTVIIALSMGSFLATMLAAQHPQRIAGLVLLSPAFVLQRPARITTFFARFGLHLIVPMLPKMGGSDICDKEARRKNPSYRRIPLKALAEFGRLCDAATRKLKDLKSPVFVAFGMKEHTVAIEATRQVLNALGSGAPQVAYFKRSAHILPLDFDQEELLKKIFAFIETL